GFEIKHNEWCGGRPLLATRLGGEYRWAVTGWRNRWNVWGMVHDASLHMRLEPTRFAHLDLMLPTVLRTPIEKYRRGALPYAEGHMQLFLMVDPVEYSGD